MGIEKLIPAALIIVMAAVASGNLPALVREVQKAQLRLLKDAQSSKWERAMLMPSREVD